MRNGRGKMSTGKVTVRKVREGSPGSSPASSSTAIVLRNGDGKRAIQPAFDHLTFDQQTALEQLVSGMSVTQAAASSDVSRATLYRWLKSDPTFRAAYNDWHNQMRKSAQSRLLAMTDTATDAIQRSMMTGDGRLAFAFLKGMGLIRDYKAGSGDPEKVKADLEWKDHRRKVVREKRRMSRVVDVSLGSFAEPEELSVEEALKTFRERNKNADCRMPNDE
jgi:AcrR family transcriptional regulator